MNSKYTNMAILAFSPLALGKSKPTNYFFFELKISLFGEISPV